jgi:hypothetical protein
MKSTASTPDPGRRRSHAVFGPLRIDKLERQLRAQGKRARRESKGTAKRLREKVADLDRRIGLQIEALETGLEPELVGARIASLREEKAQLEAEQRALGVGEEEVSAEELVAQLERLPNLGKALRKAPPALKRQVFEAFALEVRYDKVSRHIEISATVSEEVAKAFENAKDLPKQVPSVTPRDIAGAGFEPATFGL